MILSHDFIRASVDVCRGNKNEIKQLLNEECAIRMATEALFTDWDTENSVETESKIKQFRKSYN